MTGVKLSTKKGSILNIRVDDPKHLLNAPSSVSGIPHVLAGVYTPSGQFYPVLLTGKDAAGSNYSLTIPLNTALRFTIASKHVLGSGAFFDQLRQSWGSTSVPYWLAAAGSAYSNSLREFPVPLSFASLASTGGCITTFSPLLQQTGPASSDGVVCRDSALYQEPTGFSG